MVVCQVGFGKLRNGAGDGIAVDQLGDFRADHVGA